MKKLFYSLLFFLSLAGLFTACTPKTPQDFFIVYTNDVHSYIDNVQKNEETGEYVPSLRLSKIAAKVQDLRDAGSDVLLVDAGDQIQGKTNATIDKGESIIRIMNAAGYDAATPGNHDFDYGIDHLKKIEGLADFTYLSCNFRDLENNIKPFASSKIFKAGNRKVAIIGISTPETITSSTPAFFQNDNGEFIYSIDGIKNCQELYDSVQKEIDKVRSKADYVIALGHIGIESYIEKNIASSTDIIQNTEGLDAFIDGHSHTVMECNPVKDKSGKTVILTQTGAFLNSFGVMKIAADGTITTELVKDYSRTDEKTAELEIQLIEKIKKELGKEIAVLKTELYVSNPEKPEQRLIRALEMNAGDFVADSTYWFFNDSRKINCDVAMVNGGGVRSNIKSGMVTYNDVKNVQPFGNMICLIEATGQQIKDCLEMGVTMTGVYDYQWDAPAENGGFMHVAGLQYSVDAKIPSGIKLDENGMFAGVEGNYRVYDIKIYDRKSKKYEPIDLSRKYNVGGINYILRKGGNGLSMFKGCDVIVDYAGLDCDVMCQYMESFSKEGKYPEIKTTGSSLSRLEGYLIDYENPYGAGRIIVK